MTLPTLGIDDVRRLRILAQAFRVPRGRTLADQLAAGGFLRTLGGVDAYLAARARWPALRRGDLDAMVLEGALCVTPAVRGCIYLVPRHDAALCLTIAHRLTASRDERDAAKAGIRDGELDTVVDALVDELRRGGPRTTDGLRKALGPDFVRSLGDRGKKVGVSSTLPPALRRAEFACRIRRVPVDGRLDHEKYLWSAVTGDPFAEAALPEDPLRQHALLLEHFVERAGVTTLKAFADWAGLPQRDAKAALPHAAHTVVTAAGIDGEALATPHLTTLRKNLAKADEVVACLPFEDNLIHLAGGLAPWVDAAYHDLPLPTWGDGMRGKPATPLGEARHASLRSIVVGGRIRGFWEYDPRNHAVATCLFDPHAKSMQSSVAEHAASLAHFLHDELGHGRSFSLDTDAELQRRVGVLHDLETRQ